jgi:hypothetical protein
VNRSEQKCLSPDITIRKGSLPLTQQKNKHKKMKKTKKRQIEESVHACVTQLIAAKKRHVVAEDIIYSVDDNDYIFELPSQYGSRHYVDQVAIKYLKRIGVTFCLNGSGDDKILPEKNGNKRIIVLPTTLQ